MVDRKQYMRELMQKKRSANKLLTESANKQPANKPEPVSKLASVDKSIFDGKGRGVPVNGFVLIAGRLGADDYIVTESTWLNRLETGCKHAAGWSCKLC